MRLALCIAAGGSLGALARYYLSVFVQSRLQATGFPWGTLAVNLLGCALIGALIGLEEAHPIIKPEWRFFLATGLLGAMTTFSTFGLETVVLLEEHGWLRAALSIAANVVLGIGLVMVGRLIMRTALGA